MIALSRLRRISWFALLGPGTLVMLADTDAGSIIVSAQSGAEWGYQLLFLQFLLMPVLFITQELTVRLGVLTGKGLGELIKEYYGQYWAWVVIASLVLCCIGALITELSGLAAVGECYNIPAWKTMTMVVIFLSILLCTKTYFSIERIAILVGVLEACFIIIAWKTHPDVGEMKQALFHAPLHNTSYLYLLAGNIGAVIMPWMIFFQQSAIVDKGLTTKHLRSARIDTALGVVLTQAVICSVLILTAATVGKINPNMPLTTMKQVTDAVMPSLGPLYGNILFTLGLAAAAIVATIVVTLTAAWGIGEVMGFKYALKEHPKKAIYFNVLYILILTGSALLITYHSKQLITINVTIEVLNAVLLPFVLLFLFLLAKLAIPREYALKGWYGWIVALIFLITGGFGLCVGLSGMILGW